MKNWENLEADVDKILTVHFTKGRQGNSINKVVVHYNAGDLTVEGCYSVWQTRAASAHYQVESGGRIGQLVWDSNAAWHASDWQANCTSIGIEHANKSDGTITNECLDNGAHLVAAICKKYKLGRPEWLKNVFPHKYFAATSCPGQIYGSQKDAYIARAQEWYDYMTGATSTEPSGKPSESKPTTPSTGSGNSSSSSTSGGKTGTGFGGTYTCTVAALNIRSTPSTSGTVVGQYKKGQTVILDDWYKSANGYIWGRYTSYSGATRYIAVGRATGKVEADDYLVKKKASSSSSSSSSSGSTGFKGGTYRCNVATLNVRDKPSTSGKVVAQYHKGQTVVLDNWYKIANGYVWARYTAYSGKTRYVAVGPNTGKAESTDYLIRV